MKPKPALVTAGAITGTLCAAVAAFSLTTGLVHDRANDGAGELDPTVTTRPVDHHRDADHDADD